MTKEQIEKAAREWSSAAFGKGGHFAKEDALMLARISAGRKAFQAGAKWRIASVWHKPEEIPEDEKMVLCMTKAGPLICGPNTSGWSMTVEDFSITGWAYVDDLLPEEI